LHWPKVILNGMRNLLYTKVLHAAIKLTP